MSVDFYFKMCYNHHIGIMRIQKAIKGDLNERDSVS